MIHGAKVTNPPAAADSISTNSEADAYLLVYPTGGSAVDSSIFKPGHIVWNEVTNENYLVLAVDTTNNTIKVKRDIGAKHATNPVITGSATVGNTIVIVGNGFPEGAEVGQSISYSPALHFNYCQILRTPLSLSVTAKKTRLQYDDSGPYRELKREAAQTHALELEKALLLGERSLITSLVGPAAPLDTTSSGRPLRTTRGVVNWLPTATTTTISNNTDLATYSSGSLTEAILEEFLELVFRYGNREKLAFCGSTALMVLNQLAKNKSIINVNPGGTVYGFKLQEVQTVFGTLMLYNHPLLTDNPTMRKWLMVLDLDKCRYRYVRDTAFLKNRQNPGTDAVIDEFLTEAGLEMQFTGATPTTGPSLLPTPCAHGLMTGIASYGG